MDLTALPRSVVIDRLIKLEADAAHRDSAAALDDARR
jgi:hypothetical protein